MYTVMIVEDELLVRMGLMASIPWEELGLRVVAEAANGQDAWKAYQKYHPDIVMTDIRIPGMNGLELLSAVREIDPSCALIVITCVEEFSTLQETMSLGVVSYLVKATMRQQDIIVAVKKAYSFLQNNNRPPNSKSCEDEIETLIGAYFLGSIDYEVLMRRGNGDLQPEIHGFLYMRMSRTGGMTEILRRSIQNILQDRLARADAITLAWREDGILVLIRKQTQRESLRASLEGIRHYCTEMFGVEARFNACLDAVPVRSLPKAVERIVENYTEAYLYESSLLWVRPDGGISDEVVDDCLQMLRDNIWLFRDAGSVSEVRSQIDRLEADLYRGWTALSSAAYFLARYIASHAPAVTEEMFREFCHRMKEDTREMYSGAEGEYWDYDESGKPYLFDEALELKAANELPWTNLSALNMFLPYSSTSSHPDGAYYDLFSLSEYRGRSLDSLQRDFCDYYGMTYPGEKQQALADAGETIDMGNDRGQTISACISDIPLDIKRILDACNDILDRSMPTLIMAENDEAFEKVKQDVLKRLEAADEATAWTWALESWNAAREKVDPAWTAAKEAMNG